MCDMVENPRVGNVYSSVVKQKFWRNFEANDIC